ncbi:MAG TPA: hypothetical protein VEJ36_04955 [Nitrososphaerales archaeon]|nr:hypothetical protein [Nitrososphaerales archaeon]
MSSNAEAGKPGKRSRGHRSITRTLRIDEDLDEEIQRISRKDRLSINQVANRALRRFVEWDAAVSTRSLVSVPSKLLVKLMETQTKAGARELGRWAALELFVPNLKAQFASFTLDSAIEGMSRLSAYGGRFEFDHTLSEGNHVIMLRQPFGAKWSEYYAGALEGVFGTALGKKVKLKVTDDICLFEFQE